MSKRAQYRTTNWREYNAALKQRGSLEIWLSPEAQQRWYAQPTHHRGAQERYSDLAIATTLTVRKVFHLALRQTEGFVTSIFHLTQTRLSVPDYTTLSRRGEHLLVKLPKKKKRKVRLIVDSSGVKVFGAGEWHTQRHGVKKTKGWKKIHVAIDEDGEIRAVELAENSTTDAEAVPGLLTEEPTPLTAFVADGAYDQHVIYALCQKRKVKTIIIPPRRDARIWQLRNTVSPHPRDANLRIIRRLGRQRWKAQTQYHVRSLVEVAIARFKAVFGERLQSRAMSRQQTEVRLAAAALNRMWALGRPLTVKVT